MIKKKIKINLKSLKVQKNQDEKKEFIGQVLVENGNDLIKYDVLQDI